MSLKMTEEEHQSLFAGLPVAGAQMKMFFRYLPASWARRAGWWAQVRQIGLTFSTHPRQTDLIFEFQKWLREGSPIACKIKHIVLRNCYVNLDSPVNNTYGPPPLMLGHRL